jgi:hypothetical protein
MYVYIHVCIHLYMWCLADLIHFKEGAVTDQIGVQTATLMCVCIYVHKGRG